MCTMALLGGRGAEAGRQGEGDGVPLVPGSGAPGGGQSEEGGLHREREDARHQEAGAGELHRQPAGRPLSLWPYTEAVHSDTRALLTPV